MYVISVKLGCFHACAHGCNFTASISSAFSQSRGSHNCNIRHIAVTLMDQVYKYEYVYVANLSKKKHTHALLRSTSIDDAA